MEEIQENVDRVMAEGGVGAWGLTTSFTPPKGACSNGPCGTLSARPAKRQPVGFEQRSELATFSL